MVTGEISRNSKRKSFNVKNGCLLIKNMIIDLSEVRYIDFTTGDDPEEDGGVNVLFHMGDSAQVIIEWKYNQHFYELEIDEIFEEFARSRGLRSSVHNNTKKERH